MSEEKDFNMRTLTLVLFFAVVLVSSDGCKRHHEPIAPPRQLAASVGKPDQIEAGEILSATETAFGLALPDGMKVTKRLYNNIVVVSTDPSFRVAAYIQSRVDATLVSEPGKMSFLNATVKEPREPWSGNLRIDVSRRGQTTVIELWGEAFPKTNDAAPADGSETQRATQIVRD
jgi:hypothetical protein